MNILLAMEKTERDSITALELQKSKRILYFSDGIMEELSESEEDVGFDVTDSSMHVGINLNTLPLGTRIKYQAYQIVSHLLNGINYVGESLANIFGITTAKYVSESDIEHATSGQPQTYDLNISHTDDASNIDITRINTNFQMNEFNR